MNFDHSIDTLRNLVDNFGGAYFSPEEQAAEANVIDKMAVEPKENIYDYYKEENKMKEDKNLWKERLVMEYTMLIEKICDLQRYLDNYNDGSDMTQDQSVYLQLARKQMEAMCMYRESLFERIMMIMDRKI